MAEKWTCQVCGKTDTFRAYKRVVSFEKRFYYLCQGKKKKCYLHKRLQDIKVENKCSCCNCHLYRFEKMFIRNYSDKDCVFCSKCEKVSRRCNSLDLMQMLLAFEGAS